MGFVQNFTYKELLPAARVTATGNETGVDLQGTVNPGGRNIKAVVTCGNVTGTNPTLDLAIEESDDDSTYTAISGAAFTQLTAAGSEEIHFVTKKRYIRVARTAGGTSPVFDVAVVAMVQKSQA